MRVSFSDKPCDIIAKIECELGQDNPLVQIAKEIETNEAYVEILDN